MVARLRMAHEKVRVFSPSPKKGNFLRTFSRFAALDHRGLAVKRSDVVSLLLFLLRLLLLSESSSEPCPSLIFRFHCHFFSFPLSSPFAANVNPLSILLLFPPLLK